MVQKHVDLQLKKNFTNEKKTSVKHWLVDFLKGKKIETIFGLHFMLTKQL
jgi:hypothetical protein